MEPPVPTQPQAPSATTLSTAEPPFADSSVTKLFPFAGRSARAPAKGCWGEHSSTPFMPHLYLALIELIGFPGPSHAHSMAMHRTRHQGPPRRGLHTPRPPRRHRHASRHLPSTQATAAAPARPQLPSPQLTSAACLPESILTKAPVKYFLQSSLPLRAGCNQTAGASGQQAAERQSPALSSRSITMLLTTLYPGAGRLSLELRLSHYCASAHFALFTFLLFKEITLKCASASFTFCSYWSSP